MEKSVNRTVSANLYVEILDRLTPEQLEMMLELEKDAFGSDGAVDAYALVPLARNGRLILLREAGDDRPVAVCELLRDYNRPDLAYIYGFYVRSDKQGKGYGKVFLHKVFEIVKEDGFQEICLTVKPSNLSAVKLYERVGFQVAEYRKDEYGTGSDRYYMVKTLT